MERDWVDGTLGRAEAVIDVDITNVAAEVFGLLKTVLTTISAPYTIYQVRFDNLFDVTP